MACSTSVSTASGGKPSVRDPLLQGLAGPGHALGGPADSVGLALVGEQQLGGPLPGLGEQRLGPADQFLFQKFQAQAGFGAQAHHGEGVGCVLCPEHGAAVAGQIALVHHQKGVRLVQGLAQQRRVFFPQLLGPVADQQDQVRLLDDLQYGLFQSLEHSCLLLSYGKKLLT